MISIQHAPADAFPASPKLTIPKRPSNKTRLPEDFVPGKYTVICGRGKPSTASSGNQHLRSLLNVHLLSYSQAKNKMVKSSIVSSIVNAIRKVSPEGSFVKQDNNGHWWEVAESFAREKIGCIFRDILHTQYRSSTKAKLARRHARESNKSRSKDWDYSINNMHRGTSSKKHESCSYDDEPQRCAGSVDFSGSILSARGVDVVNNEGFILSQPFGLIHKETAQLQPNHHQEQLDLGYDDGTMTISSHDACLPKPAVVYSMPRQHYFNAGSLVSMQEWSRQVLFAIPRSCIPDPSPGSSGVETLHSRNIRSPHSLIRDACNLLDIGDDFFVEHDDFPDDLSDIFEM
jgi:hypothetical protein